MFGSSSESQSTIFHHRSRSQRGRYGVGGRWRCIWRPGTGTTGSSNSSAGPGRTRTSSIAGGASLSEMLELYSMSNASSFCNSLGQSLHGMGYSNGPVRIARQVTERAVPRLSRRTLLPELLHTCLTKFADWGDFAKLACVQSKWKNMVDDVTWRLPTARG